MRSSPVPSPSRNPWSTAAQIYAAVLFLLYAILLFVHTDPPSLTDYANWTYQGVLLHQHLLGLPDPAHLLKIYPVPNSASTVAIGLLTCVLPWKIAAKLWLCLQLLLSLLALRHLLRTTGASPWAWVIAPQVLFLNTNLWYGFINFELGLCWILLTASLLLRAARKPQGSFAGESIFGLLLLLAFFTHMIPFSLCCLLLVSYTVQTRRYRILWQILPAAVASLGYFLGRYLLAGNADGQAGMVASVQTYTAAFWAYKVNSYLKSFGFINPGSPGGSAAITLFGRPVFLALFVTNLVLCAVLGWCMVLAMRRSYARRNAERFLWLAIVSLLPPFLLAPATALGVSDPGSRLLQCALALAVVLSIRQGLPARIAAVCTTILAGAGLSLFALLGFHTEAPESSGAPLPHAIVVFAHVPNHDQNFFYDALDRNDLRLPVFPTGMFLNQTAKPSPLPRDGSTR